MTKDDFDINQLASEKQASAQQKLDELRALSGDEREELNHAALMECERIMARFGGHTRPQVIPHA